MLGLGGSGSWLRRLNVFCIPKLPASPPSACICSQWPVGAGWGPPGLPFSALSIIHRSLPPASFMLLALPLLLGLTAAVTYAPHVCTLII